MSHVSLRPWIIHERTLAATRNIVMQAAPTTRDRGITAYYHIGPPPVPVDPKYIADATPLFTFVLIAEHGFLRVPLALRKATSEDYCG